jgi:tetratricopeptide (TPR) repeat protein
MAVVLIILFVVACVVIIAAKLKPTKSASPKTEAMINISMDDLVSKIKVPNSDDTSGYDNWLTIDSLRFFGLSIRSHNGIYSVACSTSHIENKRRINGHVILQHNDSILYKKKFERPHDAKVGDNGVVIFNDWLDTTALAGVFYVLNLQGETIFKKRFKANLLSNTISPSGKYAACSTAGSDYEEHSNATFLFDLNECKQIARFDETHHEMRIDEDTLTLHFNESALHLIYSFNGVCIQGNDISNPTWYDNCSGYELYSVLSDELASKEADFCSINDYQYYIDQFNEAIDRIPSDNWKSDIQLRIGDIYAKLQMIDQAKQRYGAAVKLKPKAAVKRRLQKLDKITNS